jgi:hypothetical protein
MSQTRKKRKISSGRNVLLNCHSYHHDNDSGSKHISNELILNSSDNLYYNELYNAHPTDYQIDISKSHGINKIVDKFKKTFDIIYLVNCPDNVYIKTDIDNMGIWNSELFENLYYLTNDNGVVITRIAETGINALLETYNYENNTDYEFSGFSEDEDLNSVDFNSINLKVKKTFLKEIIPIIRRMMKQFLKQNDMGFKLLSRNMSNKYIHKNFSQRIDDSIYEFFVIQKVPKRNQSLMSKTNNSNYNESPQSVTPDSLLSHVFQQKLLENRQRKR